MKNKLHIIILSLLTTLSAFSCNDDSSEINQKLESITSNVPATIRLTEGESINYQLNIPEGLDATYTWVYNTEVISETTTATFNPQSAGSGKLTIVIKDKNKQYKILEHNVVIAKKRAYKTVGYLPSYRESFTNTNIQWDMLTHLNLSFARVNADGSLNDTQVRDKFLYTARDGHSKGVYVLLSLGGGDGSKEFSTALLSAEGRQNIIRSTLQTVKDLSLDGVDVDYEDWGWNDTENNRKKSDALNELLQGFREAMDKNMLLTAALFINALNYGWYTQSIINKLDYVTLMTYDKTGNWESSAIGPHAPYEYLTSTVEKGIALGIPKEKMLPGIPFYGRSFPDSNPTHSTTLNYSEITDKYIGSENKNELVIGNTKIYYDGLPMIKQKAEYVVTQQLGGVMLWEITQDSQTKTKSLFSAINSILTPQL